MQPVLGMITTPTAASAGLAAVNEGLEGLKPRRHSANLQQTCPSTGDCISDTTFTVTPPHEESSLRDRRGFNSQPPKPPLLDTASVAQCRGRDGGSNSNPRKRKHLRAVSDLVSKVTTMEEVHGVDVSWLHHPHKGMAATTR